MMWGCFLATMTNAQIDDKKMSELKKADKKDVKEGWTSGGSFGLALDQLAIFNPKVGAGQNKWGFGGIGSIFANKAKGRMTWDNLFTLQLGVQKIGDVAWQKNVDALRFGTKLGYQSKNPKLFYSIIGNLETQLTPTYKGNFLSPNVSTDPVIAKIFAPAFIEVMPGIDYRPTPNLSILFSPVASKFIIVADQDIANQGVFGTEKNADGTYKTSRFFFGAALAGRYSNKYFNDKVILNSRLDLFSNYLKDPQNIDVRFINDIGLVIIKNVSINLILDYFYDDDVLVQKKDANGAYTKLSKGGSLTEQLVVKYNRTF